MSDAQAAPRFVVAEAFVPGVAVTLGEDAVRHMRALRLGTGAPVLLLDGAGHRAHGRVHTIAKRNVTVDVERVDVLPALPAVHLMVPIADRDRMLTLAEKSAEFGATSWRPVLWKRSRSVMPRGEGNGFQRRVQARMHAALEQSGGGWLPTTYPDAPLERAIAALPAGRRFVLDPHGVPARQLLTGEPTSITFALGPEGGFDPAEIEELVAAGFERLALGPTVLRFETAGIAALALARAFVTEEEIADE